MLKNVHFGRAMYCLPQSLKSTFKKKIRVEGPLTVDLETKGVKNFFFRKTLILVLEVIVHQPRPPLQSFEDRPLKKMLILAFEANGALSCQNGLFSTF